jgi:hypothetical protein
MSKELVSLGDKKRKQLFDLYSQNLIVVKEHPRIKLEPDHDDVCVCPICMNFFPREALVISEDYDDYLTLEDVPPIALGGKVRTLTCKKCNNTGGSQLESHLANKLNFEEAMQGLQNTSIDGVFHPTKDTNLAATINVQGNSGIYIQYHPERSDPLHVSQFQTMVSSKDIGQFSLSLLGNYKKNRPEVALLRIAYLLAYSTFGFGFLINFNLQVIRNQIQSPHEKILEHWGVSTMDYRDELLGINIIKEPKELQSFLIVFELKTNNRTTRHGVLLPGPTEPGLSIYKWLSTLPENQKNSEVNVIHIPEDDYLQDRKLAFASHTFWKEVTIN